MSSTVALLKIQYRQLRLATSIILVTIAFWIITLILVYPGDEGLKSLVEVFQRPEFQAVIGTFPEEQITILDSGNCLGFIHSCQ